MKDKFEQIVGKVESGYLEPKEAVYELLILSDVSQQRELLLAYHRYLTKELSLDLHELWVDEHLKANNCG